MFLLEVVCGRAALKHAIGFLHGVEVPQCVLHRVGAANKHTLHRGSGIF